MARRWLTDLVGFLGRQRVLGIRRQISQHLDSCASQERWRPSRADWQDTCFGFAGFPAMAHALLFAGIALHQGVAVPAAHAPDADLGRIIDGVARCHTVFVTPDNADRFEAAGLKARIVRIDWEGSGGSQASVRPEDECAWFDAPGLSHFPHALARFPPLSCKTVLWTQCDIEGQLLALDYAWQWRPSDRVLSTFGPSSPEPLVPLLYAAHTRASFCVLDELRADGATVMSPTVLLGDGPFYEHLLASAVPVGSVSLRSLRQIIVVDCGIPIDCPGLCRELAALAPAVRFVSSFRTAETGFVDVERMLRHRKYSPHHRELKIPVDTGLKYMIAGCDHTAPVNDRQGLFGTGMELSAGGCLPGPGRSQ